jgi:hypothetical protein
MTFTATLALAAALAACGGDSKSDATPTTAVQPSPTRGAVTAPTSTPAGTPAPQMMARYPPRSPQ